MRIIGKVNRRVIDACDNFVSTSLIVMNPKNQNIITNYELKNDSKFQIENLPDNTALKFYVLTKKIDVDADALTATKDDKQVFYTAYYDPKKNARKGLYINAASTLIASLMESSEDTTYQEASDKIRQYLFGESYQIFAAGYCTEFIAEVAGKTLFDHNIFLDQAFLTGSVITYSKKLLTKTESISKQGYLFRNTTIKSKTKKIIHDTNSTNPIIDSSANWALNHDSWKTILDNQTDGLAARMKNMEDITDGLATMANGLPGQHKELESSSITLSSFGKWAGSKIGNKLGAYAASYGFSLLEKWIFDKKSPQEELQNTLCQISTQIQTVISNQLVEIHILQEIIKLLKKNEVQSIILSMQNSVSVIQSNYQAVYTKSQTTTGISSSDIQSLVSDILSTDTGVEESMINIYNGLCGTTNSGLASPLMSYLTDGQDLLGNKNFYAAVQNIFSFYTLLQTQGVMLCVQAHNYNANKTVNNPDTALTSNSTAISAYNNWCIGGSGINSTTPPYITQQINLFQTTYKSLYQPFINNVSSPMPDDMAIGLIPQTSSQPTPIYYNSTSNLLIFGYVSTWVKNWTSDNDVFDRNKQYFPSGSFFPLPGNLTWRYPSMIEWNKIVENGKKDYSNNIFTYLQEQGINFGEIDLSTLVGLWTSDKKSYDVAWNFYTSLPYKEKPVPPKDANYNDASYAFWSRNKCPFGMGLYHVQIPQNAQSFAMAFLNNMNTENNTNGCYANSSMNLDTYPAGTTVPSWQKAGFAKIYGMIVTKCTTM